MVRQPMPEHPSSHGKARYIVGGVSGQSPQPAVMVAGITHAAATQVLQMAVVDTTAAQPDTDSIEAVRPP